MKNLKVLGIAIVGSLLLSVNVYAETPSNSGQSQKELNVHAGVTTCLLDIASKAQVDTDKKEQKYSIGYTNTVVNLRESDSKDSKKLDTLNINTKVKYIKTDEKWYKVKYKNQEGYIRSDLLSKNKTKIAVYSKPHREHLTRRNGVFYFQGRRESYYNLPMSRVVSNMNRLGFHGSYSVRYDGVKLFNGYVMVAGDLSAYPRGSLIETSLGTGIICDTGTFVHTYGANALDIATNW